MHAAHAARRARRAVVSGGASNPGTPRPAPTPHACWSRTRVTLWLALPVSNSPTYILTYFTCAASSVERTLDELHAAVLERIEDFLMRQPGDRPLAADDPEGEQFAASFLAGAEPLGAGVAASEAFGGGVG